MQSADSAGLSGQTVSGKVADAGAHMEDVLEPSIRTAVEDVLRGIDDAVRAVAHISGGASGVGQPQSAQHLADAASFTGSAIGQQPFSWSGYIQAIGILFLLLALLWLVVWLLKRYGRFNFLPRPGSLPRDALLMEAQMPLGPRKGLMVVRFLNKRLLIGITDHQISLLAEEETEHEPPDTGFAKIMDDAGGNGAAGHHYSGSP